MAHEEFTEDDLLYFLDRDEKDGRISFDDMEKVIFDARFPEALFEKAKARIAKGREDDKRFEELSTVLTEKVQNVIAFQRQIMSCIVRRLDVSEMEKQRRILLHEIDAMMLSFNEARARIHERHDETL